MNDASIEQRPPEQGPPAPSHAQVVKWIWYGIGTGLFGFFLGAIGGPFAIYFGVRAWKAAAARKERGNKVVAAFVIGLGVVDVLLFIVLAVGTIRIIGMRG